MEFFSRDAGTARRNALAESLDGLAYYVPPELRPWLGIANELNPVVSMERAGTNALTVADPNATGWERVQALGDMSSNMAGAVAPIVAASRGAAPAAQAVEDALMGWSTAAGVPDFMADEFGGVGFRAYHGSPHDFDRFSLDKIGTGEGAQAYGHGLYFADSEDVARAYRDALSPNRVAVDGRIVDSPVTQAAAKFSPNPDDYIKALTVARERAARNLESATLDPELGDLMADLYRSEISDIDAKIAELRPLSGGWFHTKPDGRMYEVQINADPADFLDFEAPWDAQPEAVKRHFAHLARGGRAPTGEDLAQRIEGPIWAEEAAQAGIPGIRYLDAGSRGAADVNELRGTISMWERAVRKTPNDPYAVKMLNDAKTQLAEAEQALSRNYVVFDDKLIEIIRKYGWAAAAPIFAASGLTVEEAQAQYEGQM